MSIASRLTSNNLLSSDSAHTLNDIQPSEAAKIVRSMMVVHELSHAWMAMLIAGSHVLVNAPNVNHIKKELSNPLNSGHNSSSSRGAYHKCFPELKPWQDAIVSSAGIAGDIVIGVPIEIAVEANVDDILRITEIMDAQDNRFRSSFDRYSDAIAVVSDTVLFIAQNRPAFYWFLARALPAFTHRNSLVLHPLYAKFPNNIDPFEEVHLGQV